MTKFVIDESGPLIDVTEFIIDESEPLIDESVGLIDGCAPAIDENDPAIDESSRPAHEWPALTHVIRTLSLSDQDLWLHFGPGALVMDRAGHFLRSQDADVTE